MSDFEEKDYEAITRDFRVVLYLYYIKQKKKDSPIETRVISSLHFDTANEDENIVHRCYYDTKYNVKKIYVRNESRYY